MTFRSKKRQGYTLLELVIVISVMTTLIALNAGWLHQSLTFASAMKEQRRSHNCLARLARCLRHDVYCSVNATLDGDNKLTLTMKDETSVTYDTSPQGIRATRRRNGNAIGRELFRLPNGRQFLCDGKDLPNWLGVTILGPKSSAIAISDDPSAKRIALALRLQVGRWGKSAVSGPQSVPTTQGGEQ